MEESRQKELNKQLLDVCKTSLEDSEAEDTAYATMLADMDRSAGEKALAVKVIDLIGQGADVDHGGDGLPLIWAAHHGYFDVVKVLLEAGANPLASTDGKIAADYARTQEKGEVIELLDEYRKKLPEEVVFSRRTGSSILEEVFDFVRMERVTLLHTERGNPAVAFQRDGFLEVDETSLRKAFNEHVRRGGKVEESIVFPHKLNKRGPSLTGKK